MKKYTPIETLLLPPKMEKALIKNEITSVEELLTRSEGDIKMFYGIGVGSMDNLRKILRKKNFLLRDFS